MFAESTPEIVIYHICKQETQILPDSGELVANKNAVRCKYTRDPKFNIEYMYIYNQVLMSFCIESDCLSVSLSYKKM